MEIPASPFMQKLGCGTGVNVYLMKRKNGDGSPWAVKKVNKLCKVDVKLRCQKTLKAEAKILQTLDHPNIVGYRTVGKADDGSFALVMEYGGERSLFDLIEKRKDEGFEAFPANVIQKVALEVAKGLKYLHNERKILHGDMKSSNVVVMGDFEQIKICDVGFSLELNDNLKLKDPKAFYTGTEPWMPSEVLFGKEIMDKADIYAYGLTLWEMMTLEIPHFILPDSCDEDDSMVQEELDDAYQNSLGTRPALPCLGPNYQRMMELCTACTDENPQGRPSAEQIVAALQDLA
uniref:lymphokine-activated killer T-cell-originated protein kinase homolog n=1 Tax=Myxine glutinosa TaxID=7769 RepID=UPI00358FB331